MFNFGVSTHTYDSQIMTCAKTFNKTKTYDSGHTGQETICEVLSKRYENAPTLCSLNTNCFIIKTYSTVFNIDLVFEKKKNWNIMLLGVQIILPVVPGKQVEARKESKKLKLWH